MESHSPSPITHPYSVLISLAFALSTEGRLLLRELYHAWEGRLAHLTSHLRTSTKWQRNLRHVLTCHPWFVKLTPNGDPAPRESKHCFWTAKYESLPAPARRVLKRLVREMCADSAATPAPSIEGATAEASPSPAATNASPTTHALNLNNSSAASATATGTATTSAPVPPRLPPWPFDKAGPVLAQVPASCWAQRHLPLLKANYPSPRAHVRVLQPNNTPALGPRSPVQGIGSPPPHPRLLAEQVLYQASCDLMGQGMGLEQVLEALSSAWMVGLPIELSLSAERRHRLRRSAHALQVAIARATASWRGVAATGSALSSRQDAKLAVIIASEVAAQASALFALLHSSSSA